MKNNKIITSSILGISALTLMLYPANKVDALDYVKKDNYKCTETEEYKAWMKLSKEEKKDKIAPVKCYEMTKSSSKIIIKKNNTRTTVGNFDARYDLRDYNNVTPVKTQKMTNGTDSNSCWAFSTNAVIESNYLKNGGPSTNLSARHYGFYALKNLYDGTKNVYGYADHSITNGKDSGGEYLMSAHYLMLNKGPISNDKLTIDTVNSTKNNTINQKQEYDVDEVRFFTSKDDCSPQTIFTIKNMIMSYGAVGIYMYSDVGNYLSSDGSSYYYNGNDYAGHAATIIGWDDNYLASNFKTNPGRDGAWIVKNTYPNTFNIDGNQGYHYISYADKHACDFVFSVNGVNNKVVDNTYSNAYLGYSGSYLMFEDSTKIFYNKYSKKNAGAEALKEVSVYGFANDSVDIYYSDTNNFSNAKKLNSSPIMFDATGFETLNITDDIKITSDNFYIFIKYTSTSVSYEDGVDYYNYPVSVPELTNTSDRYYLASTDIKHNVSYFNDGTSETTFIDSTANNDYLFFSLVSAGTSNISYNINAEEPVPSATTVDTNGGYFNIPLTLTNVGINDITVEIRNSSNVNVRDNFDITPTANGYKIAVKPGTTQAGTYTVKFKYGTVESSQEIYIAQGTTNPGTDTPGTDTPGGNTPGTDTPGTDTPGGNTPGTDTPGTDTPGGNTPGGNNQGGDDGETEQVLISSITISGQNNREVSVNGYLQLSAVIEPSNASNKNIVWSSSNPEIAVVNNTGRVIGVKAGRAIITASSVDGSNISRSTEITVIDINQQEGNGVTPPTNPDIPASNPGSNNNAASQKPQKEENPKTGISTPIVASIVVVVTSIGAYIINKKHDLLKHFK